jgi:hypothetical protein
VSETWATATKPDYHEGESDEDEGVFYKGGDFEGSPDDPFDIEPFFEDQLQAELGYASSNYIWDGTFDTASTIDSHGNWKESFKYDVTFERRSGMPEELKISGFKPIEVFRMPVPKNETEYAVSMDFIQEHFTKDFWEEKVKALGYEAFEVPKLYGRRNLHWYWRNGMDDGTPSRDSSRERYGDVHNKIRPGNPDIGMWDSWRGKEPPAAQNADKDASIVDEDEEDKEEGEGEHIDEEIELRRVQKRRIQLRQTRLTRRVSINLRLGPESRRQRMLPLQRNPRIQSSDPKRIL